MQVRYRVVVSHAGAGWAAETYDLSARGCQVVTPRPMQLGEVVRLSIEAPGVPEPLLVFGRVAWVADKGRIRAGISFADRQPDGDPAAWFNRMLAAQPGGEEAFRRLPERLPVDTRLFLRPPPQFIFDFGPEEVAVLREVGDGTTIEALLRTVKLPAAQVTRLVFALLEQRVLTLALGEAAPAWKWKAVLQQAPGQPPGAPVVSGAPRPAAGGRPPVAPARPSAVPSPPAPPPLAALSPAPPATSPGAVSPADKAAPPPAASQGAPAGTPEAKPPQPPAAARKVRPPEAQECFDLAVSAVSMGEISTAIGLLRRALQMSPRDPEISALLGQLAFRDRQVGKQ
jgi:hypothetical protein